MKAYEMWKRFVAGWEATKWRLEGVRQIRSLDYKVTFPDEGNHAIELPHLGLLDCISFSPWRRKLTTNCIMFKDRPSHEVLLRRIIYDLYQCGAIDNNKSVIDIGAWLSDNAIIWSRLINIDRAKVFAIDPSADNIAFGKFLGELNEARNISWHQNVCSHTAGVKLFFQGSFDHASFCENEKGAQSPLLSTTIDKVISESYHHSIGLFHLDVEGFELNVMKGSEQVITKSNPVILFEQHITKDNSKSIIQFLSSYCYETYMINEILPGCRLDCRNFLAVPEGFDLSHVLEKEYMKDSHNHVHVATDGPILIPVDKALLATE